MRPRIEPYYQIMEVARPTRRPGFIMFRPFVAYSDQRLQAAADGLHGGQERSRQNYGELSVFLMTKPLRGRWGHRTEPQRGRAAHRERQHLVGHELQGLRTDLTAGGRRLHRRLRQHVDRAIGPGPVCTCAPSTCERPRRTRSPSSVAVVVAMGDRVEVGNTLAEALLGIVPRRGHRLPPRCAARAILTGEPGEPGEPADTPTPLEDPVVEARRWSCWSRGDGEVPPGR